MQRTKVIYILLLLVFISNACKNDTKMPENLNTQPIVSTYYLIRHAEKDRSDSENVDPELNQAGLGRAMHWAEILTDVPLDAIYSTDFQRTAMTAAPTAVKNDISVQYYEPENLNIEQFKEDNLGKNVLVVGHSDTTTQFVNQLIGEKKYDQMEDDDNGSLFIVQLINDKVTSQRLHFNCNCPNGR